MLAVQIIFLIKNCTEFHENPADGFLIASKPQLEMFFTHSASFLLAKNSHT
jgi:hypothetical protein